MEFQVLGPMRIRRDGHDAGPPGRLQRVLLGTLLLRANRPVPADTLAEAMWGERPSDRDRPNLHVHIHRLRGALGAPERLTSTANGYVLTVHPGELDAERFESLLDEATAAGTDPHRAAELLREACAHWHGEPYTGADTPDLLDEARRLSDRHGYAIEQRYAAELACGRHTEIVTELAEQARLHPLRERIQATLMIALYRAGQQARALTVYRDTRRHLVDELGQEPGPELRQIHERVLAGEPVELHLPRAAPVPAQLPHDVPGFVGRMAELAELDRLGAAATTPFVVVTGTAGVGKTALVRHWANEARERYPDGQLYVDLCGYAPDDPMRTAEVLAGFLRSLGLDDAEIPPETAERAARFRTLTAGRRMLVVLDNAGGAEQVRPLLPGTSSCFVLITSRDALAGLAASDGAHRLPLQPMTDDEARTLVGRSVDGIDPRDDAVTQLIRHCARLPLALRVAAVRVRERGGNGLPALLGELADERGRLNALDTGDEHTSVRAVFSWSYDQLPAEGARLFRLLAFTCEHRDRDHLTDVYAATALMGTGDVRTTRHLLDTLVRTHLIVELTGDRYALHDLLRAYATELAEAREDRVTAQTRLAGYYLHAAAAAMGCLEPVEVAGRADSLPCPAATPALPDPESAMRWLEAEHANLICVAEFAAETGRTTCLHTLMAVLRRYLIEVGSSVDDVDRLRALAAAGTY